MAPPFPDHAPDCFLNWEPKGKVSAGSVEGPDMGRGTMMLHCTCKSAGVLDQIRAIQSGDERRVLPCNIFMFHEGQSLQVWSKVDGIYRGDLTVERVTSGHLVVNNIPVGTEPGDLLISSEASHGILTPEKTGAQSD
jgi:hypothetical protein